MPAAVRPPSDPLRVQAVRSLGLLDTPPDEEFDALTSAAALVCETPFSYITLIDEDRAWFKSTRGNVDKRSNARDRAMCSHTILERELVEVADATADARFADNPSVLGPPGIRFYASVPLILSDGHAVGTLCVVDFRARALTDEQRHILLWLSRAAIAGMESRRAWRAAELANARLSELTIGLETQVESRTQERDTIWNVSSDLFGVADAHGRWLSINPAWTTLLGWPRDSLLGRTCEWLEHPDDAGALLRGMSALTSDGARGRLTNRLRSDTGDYRWLAWTLVIQGESLYCIARDVTQDHERAAALAEAEAAMRQAQKMEAIGQMTGGVAHDFNNLLATIKNCLEVIGAGERARAGEAHRLAAIAMRSVDRGVALTQRLLAFARKQPLKFEAVDVNALVLGLEEMLARLLGSRIDFRIRTEAGLFPSYIDASQFESGIVNLVINARDAIGEHGTITIETSSLHVGPTGVVGGIDLAPGDYVVTSVSDDGVGMAPDVLARAFEPFYSSKPMGQGTGLGLAMLHGFAKQSGGTATIFSARGVGTTVKLFLPRASVDVAPAVPEQAGADAPTAAGLRVLVVEDEEDLRAIVVELLRGHGLAVEEAGTAEAALEIWKSRPAFDVLVTDIRLPGMTGRALAQQVRAHDARLPVLLMTGYDTQAASPLDRLDDRTALITKPFAIEALIAELQRLASLGR